MIRRAIRKVLKSKAGAAAPATPARSYKEWWNSASTTMEAAYQSTIASTTEMEYRARGWNGDDNSYGAKHFIERCALDQTSRVLEIGCGIARIGREMAPHVREWHGADISPNMIAHARERCAGLNNVFFHELQDVMSLRSLPGASYEFVYATIVFMHLDKEDLFEYLRQSYRMLTPGGRGYFDTWNILHPDVFRIWREAAVVGDGKPRGRIQCCSPEEFRVYLEEAGFIVDALETRERLVRAFCTRAESSPQPTADDHLPPFGYLCYPENEQTLSGVVNVEGWSLDRIAKVEIFIDGEFKGQARLDHVRPEVAPLFPRYVPEANRCGYIYELDTRKLANGHHELRIVSTDVDGQSTCVIGQYRGFSVEN